MIHLPLEVVLVVSLHHPLLERTAAIFIVSLPSLMILRGTPAITIMSIIAIVSMITSILSLVPAMLVGDVAVD
jgi:hypothetical protein